MLTKYSRAHPHFPAMESKDGTEVIALPASKHQSMYNLPPSLPLESHNHQIATECSHIVSSCSAGKGTDLKAARPTANFVEKRNKPIHVQPLRFPDLSVTAAQLNLTCLIGKIFCLELNFHVLSNSYK